MAGRLLLVFEVAGIRYAVPAEDVVEVLRAVAVVPLPRAPRGVEGAIDVRGSVVPVLDVRSPFGLAPKAIASTDHLILVRMGARLVALRADRARDLIPVADELIEDARRVLPEAGHLAGLAKLPDGLVLIHDLPSFLSAQELVALDRSVEEARP